jgi:hypothetical protein
MRAIYEFRIARSTCGQTAMPQLRDVELIRESIDTRCNRQCQHAVRLCLITNV